MPWNAAQTVGKQASDGLTSASEASGDCDDVFGHNDFSFVYVLMLSNGSDEAQECKLTALGTGVNARVLQHSLEGPSDLRS